MKQIGIITPIVTPCTLSGKPDPEGLEMVCNDMLNAGCHGIFILGSTGRGPWFSQPDRINICKTARKVIGSDTPLFAGCMAPGLSGMIENAKSMADSGASMAVITAPMYFKYSNRELESIFLEFADKSPLPVVIYDIPDMTGAKLELELLKRLAGHKNVVGFKDSSSDHIILKQLMKYVKDDKDFFVLQGKEQLLLDSLSEGASGFVVSLLHVNPKPFSVLYQAVQENNIPLALKMQDIINRLFDVVNGCLKRQGEISTLFHFLNCSLVARGIKTNIMLKHEGNCPIWLPEQVEKALEICNEVQ